MTKRVLLVSDNVELVTHIFSVVASLNDDGIAVNYRYSSTNKSPDALQSLGLSEIDLKDTAIIEKLIKNFDLIISAHCKQIFPEKLVQSIRCINIHPGLNPHNRGWYPQVFSLINKKPIGCTIHLMDAEIDHGEIIFQKEVSVMPTDTSLEVYNRVVAAEKALISQYFADIVFGNYQSIIPESSGNYNGIKNFNKLCHLNLDSVGTLGEHIDLLRALTHGEFKNAYYYMDGKKVFISVAVEESHE